MFLVRNWRQWLTLGGAVAATALAATPASAAVNSCSQQGVQWTPVQQITLHPETDSLTGIWSSKVSIHVTCTDNGVQPLQGAKFSISGFSDHISDLHVTINGSDPTLATQSLPVANMGPSGFPSNQPLVLGTDLTSDANGDVTFTMRASSQSNPALSPDGSATEVGLQFETGFATPSSGGTLPIFMLGGGQIFAQTPELDSLVLFGSGAAGLAGYGLMRIRARRRD